MEPTTDPSPNPYLTGVNLDPTIWQELASIESGDFAEIPYPLLLAALARQRRTVELEMERKPIEKRIVFDSGSPVDCRSNLAHETFGRYLVSMEKLSDEDFRSSLAESFSRGVPLGEVLLERELLTPQTLYRNLQQNLARKLLDGFTWRSGSFRVVERHEPVDSEIRVNAAQLILTGIQKLSAPKEVERAIEPLRGQKLARTYSSSPVGSIRARGAAELLLAELEEEPLELAELVERVELEAVEVERALYALAVLEVVLPAERVSQGRAQPESVQPEETAAPAVTTPEAPATQPTAEEVLLLQSKVLEAFLCFRRRDSFDILGVPEEAGLEEIEAAYLETARTFAPWGPLYEALGEDQDKAQALFLATADAYAELKSTERRGTALYRRKVAREKREREQAQRTDMTIRTNLLDPEVQYQKAQELIAEGNLKKAVETLEFTADCDPQNPLYRAEAAYTRHLLDPRLHSRKAVEELSEVLRTNAKHGLTSYYLGQICAYLENFEDAERYLRQSIKLMAPDRRPIDALKELSAKRR